MSCSLNKESFIVSKKLLTVLLKTLPKTLLWYCMIWMYLFLSASYLEILFILKRRSFIITHAWFSGKLTFLTPRYAHICVRIKRSEKLLFRNILPTYFMNDPKGYIRQWFPENCFVLRKLDLLWFTVTTGLKWNWSGSSEFLSLCQYLIKCFLPLMLDT